MSKLFRAVILGPPGSGKGTISSRILKDFGLKYVASGDAIRLHIANKSEFGKQVESVVNQGLLVPDKLIFNMVKFELDKLSNFPWLLDGFPRTVGQAESILESYPINVAMNLDVPFEIIVDRIKGRWIHVGSGRVYHTEFNPPKVPEIDDITGEPLIQRPDDLPEATRARLEAYRAQTEPVLHFFKKQNMLMNFHGRYSNEIWPQVHKYLTGFIKPLQYTQYT